MATDVSVEPASLALYDDAAWYDSTYRSRRQDVRYYVALAAASGGPVLEYGVGSGRVALALARAGVEVCGVDASRPMLERFEEKLERAPRAVRQRVTTRHGDMRRVRLGRRFPLVIAPFNVVLHLDSHRDMRAFLTRVREHLEPGGELVLDFSVPRGEDLKSDPKEWHRAPRFRHPETGKWTEHEERFEYDPMRQVLLIESRLRTVGSSRARIVPLVHRQWFPREMEAVLHYAGFRNIRFTADFTDLPPTDEVDSLIVRCR
jgi:SAM-dependent methyltransferase